MKWKLAILVAVISTGVFSVSAVEADLFASASGQPAEEKALMVVNTSYDSECSFMYKDFAIEAPEDGEYYMEFWLIPAEYPDGSYTTFHVFVNDDRVGEIRPEVGNWQACRVDNSEKVMLRKGLNKISIGTELPEVPNVEFVKLAAHDGVARISCMEYESFLTMAQKGGPFNSEMGVNEAETIQKSTSSSLPLKYSFLL